MNEYQFTTPGGFTNLILCEEDARGILARFGYVQLYSKMAHVEILETNQPCKKCGAINE